VNSLVSATENSRTGQVMADVLQRVQEILDYRGDSLIAHPDSLLFDQGDGVKSLDLDSLDALDIVAWLEDNYEFELSDDVNLEDIRTVRDVTETTLRYLSPSRDERDQMATPGEAG
jgi:acyl carrier protein